MVAKSPNHIYWLIFGLIFTALGIVLVSHGGLVLIGIGAFGLVVWSVLEFCEE